MNTEYLSLTKYYQQKDGKIAAEEEIAGRSNLGSQNWDLPSRLTCSLQSQIRLDNLKGRASENKTIGILTWPWRERLTIGQACSIPSPIDSHRLPFSDKTSRITLSLLNWKGLTCNLTFLSPTLTVLLLNSTPIVWVALSLYWFLIKWWIKHVFPQDASPMIIVFRIKS